MKILLAALLFAMPFVAQASCARVNYRIVGVVTSEDGSPIRDAYVLFSWIELHDFVQQGEMRTDRSGAYSITIYFNPISDYDPEKGHICDRKLDSVIVSVYANGYRSLITKQIISGEAAKRDYVLHVASSDR